MKKKQITAAMMGQDYDDKNFITIVYDDLTSKRFGEDEAEFVPMLKEVADLGDPIAQRQLQRFQQQPPMTTESNDKQQPQMALHWLVVGYVSPGAELWIKDAGGQVLTLSYSAPPLIAVGLAYDPVGAWTWYKGRQEYRHGIEYWNTGELQEASTGITLQYGNASDPHALAEYCSCETNYLILPDEEYDPDTGQVKEPGMSSHPLEPLADESGDAGFSQSGDFPPADADELDDLDDFPF